MPRSRKSSNSSVHKGNISCLFTSVVLTIECVDLCGKIRPPPPSSSKLTMELHNLDSMSESQSKIKSSSNLYYDNSTPTNAEISLLKKACDGDEEDEDLLLYPSVPLRTSSILPRPAIVSKGETFRSYINLKDLDPPQAFPPDKKSPMTPPPMPESTPVEKPPKTLPYHQGRSASVASSIKSKLYASV